MTKTLFAAVLAVTLAACGDSAEQHKTSQDALSRAVDEQAVAAAVDRAIDEKALEQVVVGTAKGAVEEAVRDVVPVPSQEMKAIGAAVDEKALVTGIAEAVDGKALGDAIEGASAEPVRAR